MRLQQIAGKTTVSELVRSRLEHHHYHSSETAQKVLEREFPNHVVCRKPGGLAVQVKDGSFSVAMFQVIG